MIHNPKTAQQDNNMICRQQSPRCLAEKDLILAGPQTRQCRRFLCKHSLLFYRTVLSFLCHRQDNEIQQIPSLHPSGSGQFSLARMAKARFKRIVGLQKPHTSYGYDYCRCLIGAQGREAASVSLLVGSRAKCTRFRFGLPIRSSTVWLRHNCTC